MLDRLGSHVCIASALVQARQATCNACPKRKAYFCNWGMLGCWLNYTTTGIYFPCVFPCHRENCTLVPARPTLKLNERQKYLNNDKDKCPAANVREYCFFKSLYNANVTSWVARLRDGGSRQSLLRLKLAVKLDTSAGRRICPCLVSASPLAEIYHLTRDARVERITHT